MTLRAVYIRGNVGDPFGMEVFNTDTDKPVAGLTYADIHIGINQPTVVDLGYDPILGKPPETVPVDPGPKHKLAGTYVHAFTVDSLDAPPLGAQLQQAYGRRYLVDTNGQLEHKSTASRADTVLDQDLQLGPANPRDMICDSMHRALSPLVNDVRDDLIGVAMKNLATNLMKHNTCGVIPKGAPVFAPKCGACKGSGFGPNLADCATCGGKGTP